MANPNPATANPATAIPGQIKRGQPFKRVFTTLEECEKACEGREKGPRWPFTVKLLGKTYYVVALSPDNAWGAVGPELGGMAERVGGVKKELSEDAILAALEHLSPEVQKKIKDTLEARARAKKV